MSHKTKTEATVEAIKAAKVEETPHVVINATAKPVAGEVASATTRLEIEAGRSALARHAASTKSE